MKQWFQKFAYKVARWMQGRYGYDELSRFLSIGGIVLLLLSRFPRLSMLYLPALAAIIWSSIRMYSKNIAKRQKERAWYLKQRSKITGAFSLTKRRWQDRKTHKYFKCQRCGASMRVPKGKGKIKITCPKCGQETFKKS